MRGGGAAVRMKEVCLNPFHSLFHYMFIHL